MRVSRATAPNVTCVTPRGPARQSRVNPPLRPPWRSSCRFLSRAPARSCSCSPCSPCCAFAPSAMASYGRGVLYTQTNDPERQRRAALRPRRPTARSRPPEPSRPAAPASPTSAAARAPSSSAATATTCTRSTPAPNTVSGVPHGPPPHAADRHRRLARRRAGEHRRAPRPRLRAQLRRHAERLRVLALVRRLAQADPRRHARARAGRPGCRAGLRHARTGARSSSQSAAPTGSRRSRWTSSAVPAGPSSPHRAARCRSGSRITPKGTIVVSEAGASSVSSYREGFRGALRPVTASLLVGQGAACWVAVSPSGRFAYTGNAAGSISGFAIGRDGALSALNADGLTAALVPVTARPRLRRERPLPGRRQPGQRHDRRPGQHLPRRPRRFADARRHGSGRGRASLAPPLCNDEGGRATNPA